jgi:hypothetical protein
MQGNIRYAFESRSSGWKDIDSLGPETASQEKIIFTEVSVEPLQPHVRLLRSCIAASALCLTTFTLGFGELIGIWHLTHPLFWFPIAIGSFGVAGPTYISLKRRWIR